MNGWVKYFTDGNKYTGYDLDFSRSWRNSKNSDIERVSLSHGDLYCCIHGLGEYWQVDRFEVNLNNPNSSPAMTSRFIQKKIREEEQYVTIVQLPTMLKVQLEFDLRNFNTPGVKCENIISQKDKWLTLEIDLTNDSLRYFFSRNKL